MLIVDSQIHLVPPDQATWAELPEAGTSLEERRRVFAERGVFAAHPDLAALLPQMDRAGVNAAVLAPRLGKPGVADTDHLTSIDAARQYPERFGVMARLDPARPEQAARLPELVDAPEVIGTRITFSGHTGGGKGNAHLLLDHGADWAFSGCEELELPIMMFAPGNADAVGQVAKSHPSLRLVCDHLFIDVDQMLDDPRETVRPILELARYDNVAVKASSLPTAVTESYPFPATREMLREVIDAFGSERVFWGSDLSRLPCRYETLVKFFLEELDFLSATQLENVMGAGLVRWLGWRTLEAQAGDHPG
jgi:predicted TIM-barrel fold metal-dependent hydrolase